MHLSIVEITRTLKIMARQLIRRGSHEGVNGNEETVITP
jgi:hypothetical protein